MLRTPGPDKPACPDPAAAADRGEMAAASGNRAASWPRWSAEENQVFRRYVDALLRGEYGLVRDAARDCDRELRQLRSENPTASWASVTRKPDATYQRLRALAWETGRVSSTAKWTSAELRVIERHAKALARDRSLPLGQVVNACAQELNLLHLEQPLSYGPRPLGGVRELLLARARPGLRSHWSPAELQVVGRHSRALVQGRHPAVLRAGAECWRELSRLSGKCPAVYRARSLRAVDARVRLLARQSGWSGRGSRLSPQEDRLFNRIVDALVQGRYGSMLEAAQACGAELEALGRRGLTTRTRTLGTVKIRLLRRMKERGITARSVKWNTAEDRLVARYAKALVEGRYQTIRGAALALQALLDRASSASPAAHPRPRKLALCVLARKIARFARGVGVSRALTPWKPEEMQILDSYAQAVAEGRYALPAAAVQPCVDAFNQYYRRVLEANKGLRTVAGRSPTSIQRKLYRRANELGWHWYRPVPCRWSEAELGCVQNWLDWCRTQSRPRHRKTIAAAAAGLQQELASKGFDRNLSSCRYQLRKLYRSQGWTARPG